MGKQLVEEIILKVSTDDSGLEGLAKKSGKAKDKLKAVGDEAKKTEKKFKGAKKQTDNFSRGLKKLAGAAAAGLAVSKLISLGKEAIQVSRDFERLRLSLETTFGGQAPAQMAFVRSEAERLGLDLRVLATDFGSLAASTKGVLSLEQTKELFTATSEAATALGLSSQRTGMLLKALSQIASKGTVSSEELRQQMGEHLPGAFNLAAKSMGVTTQELGKMLEQGEIASKDFLPKFAAELRKTFHEGALNNANSEIAESTRNLNRWNDMLSDTGDTLKDVTTPAVTKLLDIFSFMGKAIPIVQLIKLNSAIKDIEDATGKAFDGRNFDDSLKEPLSKFTTFMNKAKASIDGFRDSLVGSTRSEDVRLALGLTEKGFAKISKEVEKLGKETDSTYQLISAAEELVKVLKEADKLSPEDFIKDEDLKRIEKLKESASELFEFFKRSADSATLGLFGLGDFQDIPSASAQQSKAPSAGLELGTAAAAEFLVRPTEDTNKIAKISLEIEKKILKENQAQTEAIKDQSRVQGH